jgi:hypothetical protein
MGSVFPWSIYLRNLANRMSPQGVNELVERCRELLPKLGKRPRTVLEKILENGSVSTYELGQLGYDQPPRAAQDLKEAGVVLKTTFGRHPSTGARMGVYSIAGISGDAAFKGRAAFPKAFRQAMLKRSGSRCNICNTHHPQTVLQIDHRIPYIVAGESDGLLESDFQMLCGSHQRSKSWECEHCQNRFDHNANTCRSCYWAFPDGEYSHVALRLERRVDLTWAGAEVDLYDRIEAIAAENGKTTAMLLKDIVEERFRRGYKR